MTHLLLTVPQVGVGGNEGGRIGAGLAVAVTVVSVREEIDGKEENPYWR